MSDKITVEDILYAYTIGYFPMAESDDGEIYWHSPDPRAVIPIDIIKAPRSLRQSVRKNNFTFTVNKSFYDVIHSCSLRDDTWISPEIIELYTRLHVMGYAHSVETWSDGKLVGGLYGISIGSAFFGESMFTMITDASKAAFYELVRILKARNFSLLDSQYINDHTKSLGAVEINRDSYLKRLKLAINQNIFFANNSHH